jgi:hypothetical protein
MEEAMASIAAVAPESTVQSVPLAMPSLEAAVNEQLEKNEEYSRLTSEEHREQHRNLVRKNLQRKQNQAESAEEKRSAYQANRQAELSTREQQLVQRAKDIQAAIPADLMSNPRFQSLSADEQNEELVKRLPPQLAGDYIQTLQQLDALYRDTGRPAFGEMMQPAPQPAQAQQNPKTFPDGSVYQFTNLPDGNVEVRLITGEVFKGDPITVAQKIAEAKVHTTHWAYDWRAKAQSAQQPPQNGDGNSAVAIDNGGAPQIDFSKIPDVTAWQMDQIASALGYKDGQEMVNDQIRQRQETQRVSRELAMEREHRETQDIAATFLANNPDFPNSAESINAIEQLLTKNNLDFTTANMEMAHSYAVKNHLYPPLSQAEIQASMGIVTPTARPTPPPMVRSQNPESYASPQLAPEQMTAQQAKAEYFRLLNEQKAGSYR